LATQALASLVEDARIGLADAELARTDRAAEPRAQCSARDLGIAVAQGEQRIAARKALDRIHDLGIELKLVARGEEDIEGRLGQRWIVASFAERDADALA